jgi:DNA-binding MarR family transcriptional regulator
VPAHSAAAREISLENLVRSIEAYRRYVPSCSLLSFEMFLVIAARGPIIPLEISRAMGVPQGVVSTALTTIGEGGPSYRRESSPPPGIVSSVMHPADARSKLFALTPKGNQLVAEMRAALGAQQGR